MSLPLAPVSPNYANTTAFPGTGGVVRAVGLAGTVEQADAVASQRDSVSGQLAFLKISKDVLFLHDERSVKIKSHSVSSSTRGDLDSDRLLEKLGNADSAIPAVDEKAGGGRKDLSQDDTPDSENTAPAAPNDHKATIDLPSGILGSGNAVYQGVISASHAGLSGRNLSVVA